ncbi:MAG: hypothetical protein ACK56I_05680, partial [bacterium]
IRAARHRPFRRGPLLRRRGRLCEAQPEGHPSAYHGDQSRAGPARGHHPAAALVPQHLELDGRRGEASPACCGRCARCCRRLLRGARHDAPRLPRRGAAAVLRQRDECEAALGGGGWSGPSEGRLPRLCRAWAGGCGARRAARHQGRRAVPAPAAAGREPRDPASASGGSDGERSGRRCREGLRPAPRGGRRLLRCGVAGRCLG